MIARAEKYLSPHHKERIFMHTADVAQLPYGDEVFDAVFGFGVLHHVPDWRRGLTELARVLKTGGSYYMEELYPTLYQNFITRHILLHPEEDRLDPLHGILTHVKQDEQQFVRQRGDPPFPPATGLSETAFPVPAACFRVLPGAGESNKQMVKLLTGEASQGLQHG